MGLFNKIQVITKLWYDDYLICEDGVMKIIQSKETLKCSYKLYKDYDDALSSFLRNNIVGDKGRFVIKYKDSVYSIIYRLLYKGTPLCINDFKDSLNDSSGNIVFSSVAGSWYGVIHFTSDDTYINQDSELYNSKLAEMIFNSCKRYEYNCYFEFDLTMFSKMSLLIQDKLKQISFIFDTVGLNKHYLKGIYLEGTFDDYTALKLVELLYKAMRFRNPNYILEPIKYSLIIQNMFAFVPDIKRFGFDVISGYNTSYDRYSLVDLETKWQLKGYGGTIGSGVWEDWTANLLDIDKSTANFYVLKDNLDGFLKEVEITTFTEF